MTAFVKRDHLTDPAHQRATRALLATGDLFGYEVVNQIIVNWTIDHIPEAVCEALDAASLVRCNIDTAQEGT